MKSKVYLNEKPVQLQTLMDSELEDIVVDSFVITNDEAKMYCDGELLMTSIGYPLSAYSFDNGFSPTVGADPQQIADVTTLVFVQMAQSEKFDDTTILKYSSLFPMWTPGWTGKAGTILIDEEQLYRSIHDVNKGQNTKPSMTPSMWTKIGNPLEEWPEWVQPTGAHNAYAKGGKVTHKGNKFISSSDANVWEPGVFGWEAAVA